MIKKVDLVSSSVNSKSQLTPNRQGVNSFAQKQNNQPNFTGLGDVALKSLQYCEKYPMLNVTVLDLTTAILPRTFFETFIGSKKKDENGNTTGRKLNIMGGFEALRRESSGLLINCIIPSFIVVGVAKLFKNSVMGNFSKSNVANSWANSTTVNKVSEYYLGVQGAANEQDRVYQTLRNMINDISGVDGKEVKSFKDILASDSQEFDAALKEMAGQIVSDKPRKGYSTKLYNFLVSRTGISENIKFKNERGFFSSSLSHLCDSAGDLLHGIHKEGIKSDAEVLEYAKKFKNLVNVKSGVGLLGVIIPLAIAAQPINRWITHKMSGRKGAPLYNDDKDRVLTPQEKVKLNAEKCVAVPLMAGVAGLSMLLERPSLGMFQFKGIFPTMDQARIIAASTFSSRIAAAEDSNELKENTIRDIATFSSFYFLGDYAAKAIATLLQKRNKDVTLINTLKETDSKNIFKRLWYWAKHTRMKSTDELSAIKDFKLLEKSKNLRACCHFGNMAFSLLSLGVFIPLYTRTQTNKKQQELEKQRLASATTHYAQGMVKSQSPAFKAFFGS